MQCSSVTWAQATLRASVVSAESTRSCGRGGRLLPFCLGLAHRATNALLRQHRPRGRAGVARGQAVVVQPALGALQFIEGGEDTIKLVLTWMDGWYKGDSDVAIIDTDVFVANAKKFGTYCAKNPTISIVNAAEEILGK